MIKGLKIIHLMEYLSKLITKIDDMFFIHACKEVVAVEFSSIKGEYLESDFVLGKGEFFVNK